MPDINKEVLFKTLEYTTSSTVEKSTFLVTSASNDEYAINVYISAVGKGNLRFYIQNDSVLRIEANIQSGNWKYALDNAIHGFYIETPTETEITFRTEILYGQLNAILPALSVTDKNKIEIQNGSWVSAENCNDLNIKNDLTVGNNVIVERDLNINGSESKINGNVTVSQGNLTISGNLSMNDASSTIITGNISSVNTISASSIAMKENSTITTSTITGASTISASTINATNLNGTANITNLNIPTSSDLNVSNLNMTGENSNIKVSGNVTASTLSINNLESSNIRIIGSNGVTISGNTRVVGNLTINGEITGQITQEQNALAGISSNTSIASENISEITITLDEQTNNKYFYADDTSKSKSYKVNINSKPIYDKLSNQNTNLTGLINTNKENISNLTTSLNTHKDQLTNADSAHYSDVYATTFHGALAGNADSATAADKLGTNAGNTSTPVYFDNGIPVICSGDLSLNATSASKLKISDTGSISQPVYFSNGIPVAITGALSNDITGNASTATSATKLSNSDGDLNVGEPAKPIYFANGIPVKCENQLSIDIDGNANSSNKAKTVLTSNKGIDESIFIVGVTSSSAEYQSFKTVSDITVAGSNITASDFNITANSFVGDLTGTASNATNSDYSTYLGTASQNYTYTTLKNALANTGKIDIIKINNVALPIETSDKSVNITVEASLSESENPIQTKAVYDLENKLTGANYSHYSRVYATTFEGDLSGKATYIATTSDLTGQSYEYVPVITSTGMVAYTDKLKYANSTNTLLANSITATASVQANYFNSTSDIRLKTDIVPMSNLLDVDKIINDINLYTFKYKSNLNEKCFGVIAQEIKDINIDDFSFVNENSDGYLSVKESKLVYLLIAGYKEQSAKIKELEERIKSLEE